MSDFKLDGIDKDQLEHVKLKFFKDLGIENTEKDGMVFDRGFTEGCKWILSRFMDKYLFNLNSFNIDCEDNPLDVVTFKEKKE